jgi:hypothetical protein
MLNYGIKEWISIREEKWYDDYNNFIRTPKDQNKLLLIT